MTKFTFDATNHVDREICNTGGRVRPACLDAAFEAGPDLVAVSSGLLLTGSKSNTLRPVLALKAWHRTETNKVQQTLTEDMSTDLLRAISGLAGMDVLRETPLTVHEETGVDPDYTMIYEAFFMRTVTIIGWAHPEDGMATIEGEEIEEAYPSPAEFLGRVYSTAVNSNHLALRRDKLIRQDVLDHHRLIKQVTGVSIELRDLVPA